MNNVNHLPSKPEKVPSTANPRASVDLEHGRKIEQATGLTWVDDFFDDDTEDLVAVFDHDYEMMIRYHMKVILPFFTVLIIALVICVFAASGSIETLLFMLLLLVIAIIDLYGDYRIYRSSIRALHVAIFRDGIRVVHDDHIWNWIGFPGAFPCWDPCHLVSKKTETIPFDQITKLTIKSPGEVNNVLCLPGYCSLCFQIPYFTVALDTGSSNPIFYEAAMAGLFEPQRFEKLVWAMKRDNYERVHRETHQILQENHMESQRCQQNIQQMLMFDTMMKYGVNPLMIQQQQQKQTPQVPSTITTSPTSCSSTTVSHVTPPM